MATGISGSETLVLTRRASGDLQQIPVITVEVAGTRLSGIQPGRLGVGEERPGHADVSLRTRAGASDPRAAEMPVDRREPVLAAYRAKAGKIGDGYFRSLPDPSDHLVFALPAAQ